MTTEQRALRRAAQQRVREREESRAREVSDLNDRLNEAQRQATEAQRQATAQAALSSRLQQELDSMGADSITTYHGDPLEADGDAEAHEQRLNYIFKMNDRFKFPMDHGADGSAAAALRGTVDKRPGSKAKLYTVMSLSSALMSDVMAATGPDDANKLQVQPYRVPDDAAVVYKTCDDCDVDDLMQFLKRKTAESTTTAALLTELRGGDYVPGVDKLGEWLDTMFRKFRKLKGDVSNRELYQIMADLLPDDDYLHPKLAQKRRVPDSLSVRPESRAVM